ncbi:MAG: hypothetical protein HXS52_12930 [Theionarchaea archaeon]|nr:hypothetical protein [Theionarchaea archaeon]MBU7038829.1 hypothetical protein [Theionarchaea archaeon]
MSSWNLYLQHDPTPLLLSSGPALKYFTERDLLSSPVPSIQNVWELPEPQKIIQSQLRDGSWKYPGARKNVYPDHHYPLVETWRQFRFLVDMYQFTNEHPSIQKAAEFLFSCQTEQGDVRGMIGNQYATYYTGAILSLLITAGYTEDPRVKKGLQWLLSMRQHDNGWTIPLLTRDISWNEQIQLTSQYAEPLSPDRSQPFSHTCTGMVLRAFASHPRYRHSEEAVAAATLLKSRFFKKDSYTSYQSEEYWVRFEFPFWWNNLVSAMDSISLIGIPEEDPDVKKALQWFIDSQEDNGLWRLSYQKKGYKDSPKNREMQLWVSLAICRIFKRYYG